MTISDIRDILDANLYCCDDLNKTINSACGSDLMSDVLAFVKDQAVLLTGLVNSQVVRTAEMMDIICIVLVRGKQPTEEMLELAKSCGIALMSTDVRMYSACGRLYASGLRGGNK